MTYNPDIPNDLPSPSIAVDAIRTNFSQYAQVFDNNHVALNTNGQGKHTNVILQQQGNDPVIEGDYDSLFIKPVAALFNTSQQLFARIPQFLTPDKPNNPVQLTFNSVNTAGPVYQSFMAGGYIVYFGQTTNIAIPITLTPAPREIVCVIANSNSFTNVGTPIPNDVGVVINSNSQFTITSAAATNPYLFTFYAIGKQ